MKFVVMTHHVKVLFLLYYTILSCVAGLIKLNFLKGKKSFFIIPEFNDEKYYEHQGN